MTIHAHFCDGGSLWYQCSLSASTYAVVQHVIPYRNGVDAQGNPGQRTMPRILITEVAFAALVVSSLVETVARAVIAVLAGIVGLALKCCSEDLSKYAIRLATWTAEGSYFSIQNALTCL